jgi:hypothetical protein
MQGKEPDSQILAKCLALEHELFDLVYLEMSLRVP